VAVERGGVATPGNCLGTWSGVQWVTMSPVWTLEIVRTRLRGDAPL
jgi:hypothetical protein